MWIVWRSLFLLFGDVDTAMNAIQTTPRRLRRMQRCQLRQRMSEFLASAYDRVEDVWIAAVVIPELKLRNVQRHIFGADFVECAHYTALEDRPKTLNRVRVNRADHVLFFAVIDGSVRHGVGQALVSGPRVGRKQANFVGNRLANETENFIAACPVQNASHDIALTLHGANDGYLAAVVAFLFIPVAVLIVSADVGFINLDNAAKLFLRLHHCGTDFMAHQVRRIVGAEAHLPLNLKGANSFFARGHEMHDLEPVAQRLVGVLEDRSDQHREPIAARVALLALPMPFARAQVIDLGIAAARAVNAVWPAAGLQVSLGRFIVAERKALFKLALRHLVDRLRTLCHGGYPSTSTVEGYCHA
jgi:hypothetical protein